MRAKDGSAAWPVRSGGSPVAPDELMGVLDGLTTSAGVKTVGLGGEYVIESVFAVIKARRADGAPARFVRSSKMRLSSEERLGALEGYAETRPAGPRPDLEVVTASRARVEAPPTHGLGISLGVSR